jgi:endonuclease/exonuclease/phosphatase family metal-dependent hydrolase
VLALQEVQSQATTTQYVVTLLNSMYGPDVIYARGFLNGATTGSGTQGVIYNTSTVQLLGEKAVGTASSTGQPRQAMRYKLRPIHAGASADFYVYNSHYKASDDPVSESRRLAEAQAIRADANALGQGAHIIYLGDFNMYVSSEAAYQHLLSPGHGQAFDPISRPGNWHNNPIFVDVFTQAPAQNPPQPLTGGGLDDRFDFQLSSGEFLDGVGLEYAAGSYHALANNGSVPLNASINHPGNTALPELANRATIFNLLTTVSDHLPVIAEFFLKPSPAVAGHLDNANPGRHFAIALRVHRPAGDATAHSSPRYASGHGPQPTPDATENTSVEVWVTTENLSSAATSVPSSFAPLTLCWVIFPGDCFSSPIHLLPTKFTSLPVNK